VWFRPRLSAGGSSSALGEFGAPETWPRAVLAQAIQQLALGLYNDGYNASPKLTMPHDPGSRPPCCWQSQRMPRGILRHPRGMRLRCHGSSAPRDCSQRTCR